MQRENNFLRASKHWQYKFRRFLRICLYNGFIFAQISSFENVSKRDSILAPVTKQWIIAKDIPSYGSQQSRHAKIAIQTGRKNNVEECFRCSHWPLI